MSGHLYCQCVVGWDRKIFGKSACCNHILLQSFCRYCCILYNKSFIVKDDNRVELGKPS